MTKLNAKKIMGLALASLIITSCKRELYFPSSESISNMPNGDKVHVSLASQIFVSVKKENKDGDNTYILPEDATIAIWPADNRDFDGLKIEDAKKGLAFDKISQKYVDASNLTFASALQVQFLPVGRYFISVILNDKTEKGKNAYSNRYFAITDSSKVELNKIFSIDTKDNSFNAWTK